MKTSPLMCKANQLTGFYMIETSVMKELNHVKHDIELHLSLINITVSLFINQHHHKSRYGYYIIPMVTLF